MIFSGSNPQSVSYIMFAAEFDDLISALRTGDLFGEELVKMKRSRKKSSSVTGGVREVSRERVTPKVTQSQT